MIRAIAAGFGLGASLIVAIGAQNAFVLKQGLLRRYVFSIAAVCTLCDWTLITLGALGFGSLIRAFPLFVKVAAWAGAIFLIVYGALSFRSALRAQHLDPDQSPSDSPQTLRAALLVTLAVSLLNPHVYLDTVVLIGSVASRYAMPTRGFFALGAGLASLTWFFGLGYGARLLAPVFENPLAWRILDVLIGIIMWSIAASLIIGELGL